MSEPRVSVVVPALDDQELILRSLPPLLAELEQRGMNDELYLVDDTGADVLAAWARARFPGARVVARESNGGFGAALLAGARRGRCEYLFAMNPDVVVRPGFLGPLVAALGDDDVDAAMPRVLLDGDEARPESSVALCVEDGRLRLVDRPCDEHVRGAPFAIGGAFLTRRAPFVESGGFDPLCAPFYFEDVDLGLTAWRRGRRVVEVPASVVEHHHRGTIGPRIPAALVQAAVEKNRLLVHWKHLDNRVEAHEHVSALWRDALDAGFAGRREELVWLALALAELDEVSAARARVGAPARTLAAALRASDPTR